MPTLLVSKSLCARTHVNGVITISMATHSIIIIYSSRNVTIFRINVSQLIFAVFQNRSEIRVFFAWGDEYALGKDKCIIFYLTGEFCDSITVYYSVCVIFIYKSLCMISCLVA